MCPCCAVQRPRVCFERLAALGGIAPAIAPPLSPPLVPEDRPKCLPLSEKARRGGRGAGQSVGSVKALLECLAAMVDCARLSQTAEMATVLISRWS